MSTPIGRNGWKPSLGAWVEPRGAAFRVWAPDQPTVDLVIERQAVDTPVERRAVDVPVERPVAVHALTRSDDGTYSTVLPGVVAGARYRYRLSDGRLLPDPVSRFQPEGVHGPSEVVDANAFAWTDGDWTGPDASALVFYEVHVGCFSAEGTFAGLTARLPELASLGITALELMPLADFAGSRNWGYDGVALFAPARCYGRPDDLRCLVDTAHRLGVAVFLDVVYNHLGPDGAYLSAFSSEYFTTRHHTPWGAGLNVDGSSSRMVRELFVENACHWVHEYHIDGLRLDATHAIADDSARHIIAELATRVRESVSHRRVLVVAEDHRNLASMLVPEQRGGWGLDAVWADDFHHEARRLMAGDDEGYYRDFRGLAEDLAMILRRGWLYVGQHSVHLGEARGTDPVGLPASSFVICLQNHDQIGNRAFGERLHHQIEPAAYRAASTLFLMAPQTPLLFMGQEWAASTPFLYFTDHHPELGRLVTEGRRQEFRHFTAFSDPAVRDRIPDPQAETTFTASCLTWNERRVEPHASVLRLYRAVLHLRRRVTDASRSHEVWALDDVTVAIRSVGAEEATLVVARLRGAGVVALGAAVALAGDPAPGWQLVLSSEDTAFGGAGAPPEIDWSPSVPVVRFSGPAAVILRRPYTGPVSVEAPPQT